MSETRVPQKKPEIASEAAAWRAAYFAVLDHVPRGFKQRAADAAMAVAMAYCWPHKEPKDKRHAG